MEKEIIRKVWPQWQIRRKLGAGAFGEVYEAVHTKFNVEDRSAIKIIPVPASPREVDAVRAEGRSASETRRYFREIVQDFVKEIQLMLSLDGSSNIVCVKDYDVVEKEGEIGWYVLIRMECLTPYEQYVQAHPLRERDVIKLGCDICTALDMCAGQKIIHRDIKPANIMVHEATGNFKLGDFGVARKLENATNGMTMAGARNYIAPEILQEQQYDHRVDIYSLGLVLYRAMNRNRMPFVPVSGPANYADADEAVRRRISGENLPPPCDASPALAAVILKACSFKPEDRFATAAEMRQALEQVAAGKHADTYILTENPDFGQTVRVRRAPEQKSPAEQNGTVRVRKAPKVSAETKKTRAGADGQRAEKKKKTAWKIVDIVLVTVLTLEVVIFTACGGPRMLASLVQLCMGTCYYHGTIVTQDYEKAAEWYRKAAALGDEIAQYNLGRCYYFGNGVQQDYVKAAEWYREAAEQGYADAQNALGDCCRDGKGVEQNYSEAVQWYRKAAEQGNALAQNGLGYCFHEALGVKKDDEEAVRWFRASAEQGTAVAQYNLGNCYQYGWGVSENPTEAIRWYREAAAQGHQKSREQLEKLGAAQ